MYENSVEAKSLVMEPDFSKILSSLREESNRALDLSNKTSFLASSLKPFPPSKGQTEAIANKEPVCFVDFLWAEIYKIRSANDVAESNFNHMRDIVGS